MVNTFELYIKLKYNIKGYPHLCFGNKMLINIKNGRVKKQCYNGGSIGYWLDDKVFKSVKWIKNNIEIIETLKTPF